MTVEVDVLVETYAILKQFIPSKDRQEAADSLVSVLVDMLGDHELEEFCSADSLLKRALKEYGHEDDSEENSEDWE